MATIGPIAVTQSWTKIYDGIADGAFCGGVQALGASVVVARVQTGNVAPNADAGGFILNGQIYPIKVLATESLWARASDVSGSVVLG